jgi:hypothetical protein
MANWRNIIRERRGTMARVPDSRGRTPGVRAVMLDSQV